MMMSHPLMSSVHTVVAHLAMSLLVLASIQALIMGWQNYLLKHHTTLSLIKYLPPLQSMEKYLFMIIWSALVALSMALLSGFQQIELNHVLMPKIVVAILAWGLLISLLIGHYGFGWRGPTAIRWTLYGTVLTLFSYFGTQLFFSYLSIQ